MDPDHLRVYGIGFAFAYSFGTLIQAAVVQVVAEYYTQTPSTFQDSLAVAFHRFWGVFGYSLVYAAALIILGVVTICCFFIMFSHISGWQFMLAALPYAASMALSVYIMCSLTLALPVLVIEKQSPIHAITRSFDLIPNYRLYVFGAIFPLAALFIPHFLMMMTGFSDSAAVTVCKSLPALFTLPLQAIFITVLYLSIRVQKEGLDMEMLLNQLNGSGGDAQIYSYDTLLVAGASPPFIRTILIFTMTTTDNLFTFLSVGNAVDRTFSIYMSRWVLFSQLALVIVLPQIVLNIILLKTLLVDDETASIPADFSTLTDDSFGALTDDAAMPFPSTFPTMSPQLGLALAIQVLFSFLFGILIQAATIQIVAEHYTSKLSTFRGSLVLAVDRFYPIFGYGLLGTAGFFLFCLVFGVLLGVLTVIQAPQFFFVLIIFAAFAFLIYVMLSLTIVLPILVIEKQTPVGAIKRSFELLPTYRCYVFCSMVLLAIVLIFGSMVYQAMIGAMLGASILSSVVSGLSAVVTLPLQTIIAAVLYFSVRVQTEGLNLETLVKELEMNCGGSVNYKHVILAEADDEVV
ncbi:hypothetical protein FisN_22Lh175 [Fistulifera solaris]|uniref:Uncharacterized protein n=1 Tax=Fistulifera solaris TaxID=1519565 RepID=A0A1Z5JCI3_FISSO|nr:hypothetical protein FisN_22Lh175 [Fistulifera solaris]|eukprot:GAX11488.1 hypothetical protein FisN_22Lh175 [Fistulifera solaris]